MSGCNAFATLDSRGLIWQSCRMEKPAESFFDDQWAKFTAACGIKNGENERKTAMNTFKALLTKGHFGVEDFDKQFFKALKIAIGKDNIRVICEKGNAFVLRNRRIGFARQIDRSCLNLRENRWAGTEIRSDHWCVVFDKENKVQDATSVVVLKFGENNCNDFASESSPSANHSHSPVAQSLLLLLDAWHCSARRGIQAGNTNRLHALVLGAMSKDDKKNKNKLCCVDIVLNIPEYCHDFFTYSINLAVKFDDVDYYKIALAAYLRVMTIGLQKASTIEATMKANDMPRPISLCCRTLSLNRSALPGALLVASPIPGAKKIREDLSVNQGELFEFNPRVSVSLVRGLLFSSQNISYPVLIKVCCTVVHNYVVHPSKCHAALFNVFCNKSLKSEISKVLIAYIIESDTTYITIMRDLTKNQNMYSKSTTKSKKRPIGDGADSTTDNLFIPFTTLSPEVFKERMCDLWKAFANLVNKVLLPMANLNVIHADIRPGWKKTYNILCQCDSANPNIELRLIDLESLMIFSLKSTGDGRCMTTSLDTINSSHQFLWWQVMHVAYVWFEQLDNDDPKTWLVRKFVRNLFCWKDSTYEAFRQKMGTRKQWKKLRKDKKDSEESVKKLLDIIQKNLFQAVS